MFTNLVQFVTRLLKHGMQKMEHTNHENNTDIVSILESQASVASIVKQLSNEKAVIEPAIRFLSERRPGIWLERRLPRDFEHPSNSYLGGIPGLNSHSDWPYDNKGRRAFFVGQLDCREIHDLLPGYLPDTGTLCFFVDQDMENFCEADDTRKCYVVHVVNDGKSMIDSVPDDYPKTGNWLSALDFERHSLEDREFQPRIWPKADLKPHRFATFDSSYEYRESIFPSAERRNPEQHALWQNCYEVVDKIENDYMTIKRDTILGPKVRDDSYFYKLFPKTVPVDFHQYKDRPYSNYGPGFPWTRLHISRTLQCALGAARDEFKKLKMWHFSELLEILKLDGRYNKYIWGFAGTKSNPGFISDAEELQALSASIKDSHPELWDRFRYALELEQFYKEASALYEVYVDNPFSEPSADEKEQFVDWLAGWINHGCAKFGKRLAEALGEKSFPVLDTGFDLPREDTGNKDLCFSYFFASHLQSACHSAFCDSSIMCLSHSAALSELIPKETFEPLLRLAAYNKRYDFHRCLGYGACVQHAAYQHRDKVLLLEVRSDKALFTNFGDGALQFWIRPEDLAARRFDQAFATSECT